MDGRGIKFGDVAKHEKFDVWKNISNVTRFRLNWTNLIVTASGEGFSKNIIELIWRKTIISKYGLWKISILKKKN